MHRQSAAEGFIDGSLQELHKKSPGSVWLCLPEIQQGQRQHQGQWQGQQGQDGQQGHQGMTCTIILTIYVWQLAKMIMDSPRSSGWVPEHEGFQPNGWGLGFHVNIGWEHE